MEAPPDEYGTRTDDITEQEAAGMFWALMDGHLHHLLVTQRGWTTTNFTQWLAGSLAAPLRPASHTGCGFVVRHARFTHYYLGSRVTGVEFAADLPVQRGHRFQDL